MPATDLRLLARAQGGDNAAFDALVAPHHRRIHLHCYRMLGSPHDADDALQETLIAAWRALASFEGRSALHTWLHRIGTNVCLRLISQRPRRLVSPDYGPAFEQTAELGAPVPGPVWIEPLLDDEALEDAAHEDPATALQRREHVALAFVAALQHLPGTQRAVLLMREVLGYSAAETAEALALSTPAVNSALQRAQKTVAQRLPAVSQAAELQAVGTAGLERLLADFARAWDARDVPALVGLLTEDARFTMPPLPAWFDGREAVARFLAERVFQTPWILQPLRANGQVGYGCYLRAAGDHRFRLGAITLLALQSGRISGLHSFLEPALHQRFGLPADIAPPQR